MKFNIIYEKGPLVLGHESFILSIYFNETLKSLNKIWKILSSAG